MPQRARRLEDARGERRSPPLPFPSLRSPVPPRDEVYIPPLKRFRQLGPRIAAVFWTLALTGFGLVLWLAD